MADAIAEVVIKREGDADCSERKNITENSFEWTIAGFFRFRDIDLVGEINDVPNDGDY